MSKIDLVRQEMMKALKARDRERKEALSILLTALKAKFIDKRADLTEDEENTVVAKQIKMAQETMELSPRDRTDIIGQCQYRIGVYSEFAPKSMSEEEIRAAIKKATEQLGISKPEPKDKGRIMKTLMPAVKGKADGGLVNKLVCELLQQP